MPLRYAPLRAALAACEFPHCASTSRVRCFHASRALRDDGIDKDKNHYEALNVKPDATPAEIKKSFYSLSKTHHPDHNPSDPHATKRFMRISEAYAVLGHAEKRALYDRDVMRHQPPSQRTGSYHSTGPAGGRPASGLSRRRGTFTGPPPSFYRSGGWGAHSAKRRAAHEESTGAGGSQAGAAGSGAAGAGDYGNGFTPSGGMGPGQDPFGHGSRVPHFDRDAHERSGRHGDKRRARRRAGQGLFVPDTSATVGFFIVAGILVFGMSIPALFGVIRVKSSRDGSRRKNSDGA